MEMIVRCVYDKLVPVSELKRNPKNPNKHDQSQIDRLAQILSYQGIRKPIIVSNRSGLMSTGHGTLDAIERNGWTHAPVSFQDFESEEQEYAHMVADNSIQQWSEIDLSAVNAALEMLGPETELALLGLKDFVLDFSSKTDNLSNSNTYLDQADRLIEYLEKDMRAVKLVYKLDQFDKVIKWMEAAQARTHSHSFSEAVFQTLKENYENN